MTKPENCGSGFCSCIKCLYPEPVAWRKKVNGVWHYFDESTPFPFDDCEPLYEKP